jgi:hypothetical protein
LLPIVKAENPALTASFADHTSHTVGKITGLPGWCIARNAAARCPRTS